MYINVNINVNFPIFYISANIMKMDLETKGIGGRHRDNSHHFAAESEALDQIAKEVK